MRYHPLTTAAIAALCWLPAAGAGGSNAGELRDARAGVRAEGARTALAQARAAEVHRLDVLVLIYTRSFAHTLDAAQLERLQEEIVEFADFYQTHGGERVQFHFTLLQLDRELRRAEVSEVAPGRYYLSRENVEAELTALGLRGRFDEVVAFYAWNNANPDAAVLAYGGGAVGPDGNFLGDAGFNSIGVFAWDPGRIAQIAVHEVLHNVDDMFSRSGMADAFLNSDEMSRNMALLLRERPGAFLPYFSDPEMLAYAARERAGQEMYPWWMQRIYYAWMLERTPAAAWNALRYGRTVERRRADAPRPLYDAVYVSRATPRSYLPLLGASGAPRARTPAGSFPLAPKRYALEDFDGTPLVERPYHAGWVQFGPAAESEVRYTGLRATTRVHRLKLGDVIAPALVVSRTAARAPTLEVVVREAGWPEHGDTLAAGVTLERATGAPLHSAAARRHRLAAGTGDWRIVARADSFWIAPAPVRIEQRGEWRVASPATLEGGTATPLGLRVGLRDERAIDAVVSARVGGRTLPLRRLPDGEYHATIDRLPPGLHEAEVTAERPDGSTATDTVLLYARPNGWIRTPTAVTAHGPGVPLEVSVHSRMGERLRGLRLPLIAVYGDRVAEFVEDTTTGAYTAVLELPPGEHRAFVTSLEGDFQRRVVIVRVTGEPAGAGGAASSAAAASPPAGSVGPLPYAVAIRAAAPPTVDGELAEWTRAPLRLDAAAHLLTDSAAYGGPDDLSAELWFAWDDSTLYVAGRVRDDSVTVGEAWDRDRLNLVLDWRENDTPITYGADGAADVAEWQPDDYWLFFQPFWAEAKPGTPRRMDRQGTHALGAAQLAARRMPGGYTFELALPAAALPEYAPFVGHVAGLQLFATDGDGAAVSELMWSHRWAFSAAGGLAWELPRMGRLVFVGAAQ